MHTSDSTLTVHLFPDNIGLQFRARGLKNRYDEWKYISYFKNGKLIMIYHMKLLETETVHFK